MASPCHPRCCHGVSPPPQPTRCQPWLHVVIPRHPHDARLPILHPSSSSQPQHPAAGLGAQRGGKGESRVPLPSPAFLGSETQELAGHSCFLWPPLLRCLNKALLPLPGTWGLKQDRQLVLRGNVLLRHILGSLVGGRDRGGHSPHGEQLWTGYLRVPTSTVPASRAVGILPNLGSASPPSHCHHIAMETEP